MLTNDGNDNSKKSVGLKLAKKKQLYTCNTLVQLHIFCTTTTNVKLPSYTSCVRNVVCAHQSFVVSVSVRFFHCRLLLWIKGYLDDNNEGKWKSFVNHYNLCCKLDFSANLKYQDTHLLNISDPFLAETVEYWSTLRVIFCKIRTSA